MTRKLVRIAVVDAIEAIPDANNIEVSVIGGWKIVTKKGEFKAGSRGAFFEIDSALPYDDDRYEFLRTRCVKQWKNNGEVIRRVLQIRTIKLRGVISQGLLLPVAMFPELAKSTEGEDVSGILGVRHIDDIKEEMRGETGKQYLPIPGWMPFRDSEAVKWLYRRYRQTVFVVWNYLNPRAKREDFSSFPSFVPKTDEERIQNLSDYFERHRDIDFEITEKVDGSSMTVIWSPTNSPKKPFIVCSRNVNKGPGTGDDEFSAAARQFDLPAKMAQYNREIAIQGELVGPGRNGNNDKYDGPDFQVFRIWDITNRRWLTPDERYKVCGDLGLHHVHIIDRAKRVFQAHPDMASILKLAEGKTTRGNEREGIVCKSLDGLVSFKVINNRYLLADKE